MKVFALVLAALSTAATDAAAQRPLRGTPVGEHVDFRALSGAFELRDGRVLVTDAEWPAIVLIDPIAKSAAPLGSVGGGPTQFVRPGGIYPGLADSLLVLDRAQSRFLVISPAGAITGSRSIAMRGRSSASDVNRDLQQLDHLGLAYFRMHRGLDHPDSIALVRFESRTQRADTVALLRNAAVVQSSPAPRMRVSRKVIGSPEDGWAVAPDGRVAVVRAAPYRVEWYAPDGQVTRGLMIPTSQLPMTEADREHIAAQLRPATASVVSVGGSAQRAGAADDMVFADVKPPFDPHDVAVSPDGYVWVRRSGRLGDTLATWDVFDARGQRVDRVQLPAAARIIGWGRDHLYAAVERPDAAPRLERFDR